MIIKFEARDLMLVAHFADRQHFNKVRQGATDLKHSTKLTPFEIHYIGALGEFAVAKATKSKVDWEVRHGSDGGVDLIVNGKPVQVKTFRYQGPDKQFYLDTKEQFITEVCYMCRIVSPCQVEVVGTIDRATFLAEATCRDYGYGMRWSVPESLLRPLE